MSKDFIKVHMGLLEPKHYEKMGKSVWLYLRVLSKVDWTTGVYVDWRDAEIAEESGLAISTIRNMRQQLVEEGYIVCRQNGRGLTIEVCKWRDPRKTTKKKPTKPAESDMPNDPPFDPQVIGEITTPTYSQDNTLQITELKDSGEAAPSDFWEKELSPTQELTRVPFGEEFEEPKRQSAKQRRAERDAILDHPAIQAYRRQARLNVDFTWREPVVNGVGSDAQNVAKWEAHIRDWIGRGWKKTNIKGMLESFQNGGIQQKNKREDAKARYERRLRELADGH